MRAVIVTVGDELVSGHTLDTNSAFLAARLQDLGIPVRRMIVTPDDIDEIALELGRASKDGDLVFVTGGLGPTDDDVTRQAVARAFGTNLVLDPELHERLTRRFAGHASATPEVIKNLATIPRGARIIRNPVGAAPGLAIRHEGTRVYVLPGVPREMEAVFTDGILGDLSRLAKPEVMRVRILKTTGLRESEIAEKLRQGALTTGVRLGYLPRPAGVDLRLTAAGSDPAEAESILDRAVDGISPLLGKHVYSTRGEEMHDVVGRLLLEAGKMIAVAESCTGGLIGHLLTQVAGISGVLDRVIVTYSNRAKIESLGVGEETLEMHGAVSPEVAEAMAHGVRAAASSDIGLSTTGIAGPGGGTEHKPVGLVYFGLAYEQGYSAGREVFTGPREIVKLKAAIHAMDMVRCHLLGLRG